MSSDPSVAPAPRRSWWFDPALIAAAVVALHLALVRPFPIIYGGDTIIRLVNPRAVIAYQLPMFGWLLRAARGAYDGPAAIWLTMALLAAACGAGAYALARELSGSRIAGLAAGLLLGANPFVLYYGRVPYQESLLAAGVVWGFVFALRGRWAASGAAIAVAALARYEGWIAAAAAAVYYTAQRPSWKRGAAAAALFGLAPALWIAWNRGLSPPGTFVVSGDFSFARLYRPYFIAKSALWWSGPAVAVLAAAGLHFALYGRRRSRAALALVAGFVAALLAALVVSGHGIAPDPERLVTEREAFLPVVMLAVLAGIGASSLFEELERLAARSPAPARIARALAVVALLLVAGDGVLSGIGRVAEANADPQLQIDYEVARFLAARGSGALVFAPPLPPAAIDEYLRLAERAGGPEGRARARSVLAEVETASFDYQRIVAYAWMARGRIVSSESLRGADPASAERLARERGVAYVVVVADYEPADPAERALMRALVAGRQPEIEVQRGARRAAIYGIGGP